MRTPSELWRSQGVAAADDEIQYVRLCQVPGGTVKWGQDEAAIGPALPRRLGRQVFIYCLPFFALSCICKRTVEFSSHLHPSGTKV